MTFSYRFARLFAEGVNTITLKQNIPLLLKGAGAIDDIETQARQLEDLARNLRSTMTNVLTAATEPDRDQSLSTLMEQLQEVNKVATKLGTGALEAEKPTVAPEPTKKVRTSKARKTSKKAVSSDSLAFLKSKPKTRTMLRSAGINSYNELRTAVRVSGWPGIAEQTGLGERGIKNLKDAFNVEKVRRTP